MQQNHIKGPLSFFVNQKLLSFVLKYTRAIKKFERRTLREVSGFVHYERGKKVALNPRTCKAGCGEVHLLQG